MQVQKLLQYVKHTGHLCENQNFRSLKVQCLQQLGKTL